MRKNDSQCTSISETVELSEGSETIISIEPLGCELKKNGRVRKSGTSFIKLVHRKSLHLACMSNP